MKIVYIEMEDKISSFGHGVEFFYTLATDNTEKFSLKNPVAFIDGYAWRGNTTPSITVLIRPVSSPTLSDRDQQPEIIILEVKKAISKFLQDPAMQHYAMRHGKVTEHIRIWFNA
jgi:hypothetical protein